VTDRANQSSPQDLSVYFAFFIFLRPSQARKAKTIKYDQGICYIDSGGHFSVNLLHSEGQASGLQFQSGS